MDLPICLCPRCNKSSHPITPQVFINGNGDEKRTSDGLVTVNRVGAANTWQAGNLDSCTRITEDHNDGPWPLALVTNCCNDVAKGHDQYIWNHGGEPHLRLANAIVPRRCTGRNPVAKRTCCSKAEQGSNKEREVGETYYMVLVSIDRYNRNIPAPTN